MRGGDFIYPQPAKTCPYLTSMLSHGLHANL